jgi:hypothetical protein
MLTAFYSWLQSSFGSLATICPVSAAETAAYPVLLYQLTADRPTHTLDGVPYIVTSDVRLEVMSLVHAETDSIANTIAETMDGYRGTMTDGTETIFAIVRRLDGGDQATVYDPSEDAWVYIRRQEYQLRWCDVQTDQGQGRSFSAGFSADFGGGAPQQRSVVAPTITMTADDAAWEQVKSDYQKIRQAH